MKRGSRSKKYYQKKRKREREREREKKKEREREKKKPCYKEKRIEKKMST